MEDHVEHSWPKKGDRLFPKKGQVAGSGHQLGDTWFSHPDWEYLYREGWFEQGSLTARHLLDETHAIRPFPGLVLPMLYAFRHYLELSLKAVITDYAAIANERCPQVVEDAHGLMQLWNAAKPLLQRQFPGTTDPTPRVVEACLNDFHAVDSSSQTFRYATFRNGKSASDALPAIDVAQLSKTMENLHSFFEGCSMWAGEALSWKAEMEAEYRDCY